MFKRWISERIESLRVHFPEACGVKSIGDPGSVTPACFKRWFDMAHHRRVLNWTPDKNIRG